MWFNFRKKVADEVAHVVSVAEEVPEEDVVLVRDEAAGGDEIAED